MNQPTAQANTLDEVKTSLLNLLEKVRKNNPHLGYVSGIISSDGEEYIARNKQILSLYTLKISLENNMPTFSTVDIFSKALLERTKLLNLPVTEREQKLRNFWEEVLSSGLITDIYFTPRWRRSTGAKLEHQVAKKHGLTLHYVIGSINDLKKGWENTVPFSLH